MTTHQFNLATEPYNAIASGLKTIEARLYDEKRQQIVLGDTIVFTNRENPQQQIKVTVTGLLRYKDFATMFSSNDAQKFGGESTDWLLNQIRQFYSESDEQELGVIGIQVQLI